MLIVTALIGDPVQVTHAVGKLRALGIAPEAIRTIKDPGVARALAAGSEGDRLLGAVVGALVGLLLGGAVGWMLGGSFDPLAGPTNGAVTGTGATALVGLAVGLVLGLLVGWLSGSLGQRGRVAAYVNGVSAGDTLLVTETAEEGLREVEALLESYGARGVRARPKRDNTRAPTPAAVTSSEAE